MSGGRTGLEESTDDLYDHAPCGYFSTSSDGTIVKINQTLLNWLGYERTEVLEDKKFRDLLNVGGKIFYETHFAPLVRMQGAAEEINFDFVGKGGKSIPVLTTTRRRQQDPDETNAIYRTTVFNISDRKKYEYELRVQKQKAEMATRAKADFLSTMSHEIRTPMNAVLGITNLLATTELSPLQAEYVDMLKASSDNLLGLLNSILEISKIESGVVRLEELCFDCNDLIAKTLLGLEGIARTKNLQLEFECDPAMPPFLMGDTVKLRQIFTNLVGNAIKFTPSGKITVKLTVIEKREHLVSIKAEVIDTGIGIASDRQREIFEEYKQVEPQNGDTPAGTGLGLAITRKLVEMYGGKLQVESVPGQGSNFNFHIQLRIGSPEADEVKASPVLDPLLLNGLKILVAEDNEDNIYILSRLLKSWGVDAQYASDGAEAFRKIEVTKFDLLLMDLRMPVMDGYQTAEKIRALPGFSKSEFPIIAFSASLRLGEPDPRDFKDFNDSVGKPFRPGHLFERIAVHTGRL